MSFRSLDCFFDVFIPFIQQLCSQLGYLCIRTVLQLTDSLRDVCDLINVLGDEVVLALF